LPPCESQETCDKSCGKYHRAPKQYKISQARSRSKEISNPEIILKPIASEDESQSESGKPEIPVSPKQEVSKETKYHELTEQQKLSALSPLEVAAIEASSKAEKEFQMNRLAGYMFLMPGGIDDTDDEFDYDENCLDSDISPAEVNCKAGIPRLSGYIAAQIRMEHVINKHTDANVAFVQHRASQLLQEYGVRKNLRYQMMPYIVKFAFIETKHERMAREMTMRSDYQRRYQETYSTLEARSTAGKVLDALLWKKTRKFLYNAIFGEVREPIAERQ
jgi:hypothetical protein